MKYIPAAYILLLMSVTGCSIGPDGSPVLGDKGSAAYVETVVAARQAGLRKLRLGMTRAEVEAILPQPELVEVPGPRTEYLVYRTSTSGRGVDTGNTTPVCLVDGKVIGWGNTFYTNKEQAHSITIK